MAEERYFRKSHNYYEQLVYARLMLVKDIPAGYPDFLEDVACVALNRLPPRYVKDSVNLFFYTPINEIEAMQTAVAEAVDAALIIVRTHLNRQDRPD